MPEVKKVTFVSKEQGLEELRKSIGADGTELLEGYDKTNNPLPDSFTVDVFDPQNIAYAAKKIDAIGNADRDEADFKREVRERNGRDRCSRSRTRSATSALSSSSAWLDRDVPHL